jgi:hypothetical protein
MADSAINNWPKEEIPDQDSLFMRVHRTNAPDGELAPGAFRDIGRGMSTDWQKYSTPDETRARAKAPHKVGVIGMVAGGVRGCGLLVEHDPIPVNRAHTEIVGIKSTEVRFKLLRLARWVLPLEVNQSL